MDFFKHFFRNSNGSDGSIFFPEDSQEFTKDSHLKNESDLFGEPAIPQYFQNELNEILKAFGFGGFDDVFSSFSNSIPTESHGSDTSLRDHFLKDGYQKLNPRKSIKADQDLDEDIKSGNLNSLLRDENKPTDQPYHGQTQGNFFSSQSHSFRTIAHPDGTIETEKRVRDSSGNEETTVCHKLGSKEYCIIKRKNKNGEETVTENLTNMTENEKDLFIRTYGHLEKEEHAPYKFPFNFFE